MLCVNLPYRIRDPLKHIISSDTLGSLSVQNLQNIFNDAQQNIYDLMSNDSFPRFQLTTEYNTYQLGGPMEVSEKNEVGRDSTDGSEQKNEVRRDSTPIAGSMASQLEAELTPLALT